jgi:hypothetical protein
MHCIDLVTPAERLDMSLQNFIKGQLLFLTVRTGGYADIKEKQDARQKIALHLFPRITDALDSGTGRFVSKLNYGTRRSGSIL